MFSRLVGEVDGASGDATRRGMIGRVGVMCLEHIPVWQNVKVGGQQRIVSIDEYVPWVRCRNVWEEICKENTLVRIRWYEKRKGNEYYRPSFEA